MNQLQAVALNEGPRCKKRLWRDAGREQLAKLERCSGCSLVCRYGVVPMSQPDEFIVTPLSGIIHLLCQLSWESI